MILRWRVTSAVGVTLSNDKGPIDFSNRTVKAYLDVSAGKVRGLRVPDYFFSLFRGLLLLALCRVARKRQLVGQRFGTVSHECIPGEYRRRGAATMKISSHAREEER